ncbi:MAG: hypothetical protein GY710_17170 [Desulfobacteraceae bacterium]|nr:hypothetical protein [Desulfobacteraceae bacterium]
MMRSTRYPDEPLIGASFFQGCSLKERLPQYAEFQSCIRIKIAPGPEDIAIDRWGPSPRLLISCRERRNPIKTGEIYTFDLNSQKVKRMCRLGDMDYVQTFSPHGIDIRHNEDKTFLYVILHDPHNKGDRLENAVAIYQVFDNHLEFIPPLLEEKDHLWSPNDLFVLKNGEIYLTNDFKSIINTFFRKNTSDIVHFNPTNNQWQKVGPKLALANGIFAKNNHIYVSTTRGDTLYRFPRNIDGTLGQGEIIVKVKGMDNIMPLGNKLIIPAHFDDIAFLKHQKSDQNISPSAIFLIDPVTKTKTVLYSDSGKQFSAASTGLIFDKKLYASQVFDPYLLICKPAKKVQ